MTVGIIHGCRLGSRFEDSVPLRAGEKPIEGEEGVKVVEKTFWQKYVSFLVRHIGFIKPSWAHNLLSKSNQLQLMVISLNFDSFVQKSQDYFIILVK